MARKKTTALKPTAEWKTLLTQASHQEAQNAGEVYRIKPVDLDTFVTSKDYLGQDLWGMSENQREFLEAATDLGNNINFFVLWVGKGGGKNWSVSVAFLYVVYQLLCMYDPHKYLNHNRDKAISLINVAINAPQANHNFFKPLTSILRHAGRKAFIDFGFNPDTDIQANMVLFPNNIQIISANSHAGGIEGYDILMALADEIDDVEFHGAERILDTLRTSARSRFSGKEKVMAISYRRYTGSSGKILELYNSAVGKQHIFARRYASWEFHPIRTRADFDTDFDENPEKAACIYGSIDTGSFVDSWIKDVKRLKSSFNLNRTWIFDWPLPYQVDEPGSESWWNKETHAEWRNSPMSEHSYHDANGVLRVLDPYDMPIKYYGDSRYQYVFIGDPALGSEANGGDGYGLCLAHREIVKDERGNKHVRPVIDFAFRFTGRMFEEGQVQMKAVELLFKKLKERYGYNIKVASFDGWNSASISQWIAKTYKDVIVYNSNLVEYQDYTVLRDCIFGEAPPSNGKGDRETNGGIDIPWHPVLFEELRNLREDRTKPKAKVDHPETGGHTKDISDTVAKACRLLVYQWPFTEISTAGGHLVDDVKKKVANSVASDSEVESYNREINSNLVGLGSWRNMTNENSTIKLEDVIPNLDW